jgi:prepilin-type N-terminal cleavage/methylation domain-containing protein
MLGEGYVIIRCRAAGFTLIELIIVLVIIMILALVAVPSYQVFVQKARFTDFSYMFTGRQTEVAACYNDTGTFTGCNGGTTDVLGNSISPDVTTPIGNAVSITVMNGVISGQASSMAGGYTYILTPTVTNTNFVIWGVDGTCLSAGMCHSP